MARNLTFTINGRTCYPNYSGNISFTTSRERDERFYRTSLDADLVFTDGMGDYSWIRSQAFDTEFKVVVTAENGFVWRGVFYKTDCTFDADDRKVTVKPSTDDLYKRLLERMDDSIDVVKLAPKATSVSLTKRAVVQVYVVSNGNVGDKVVTNWLGNMTWEEQASVPSDLSESALTTYLTDTCKFSKEAGPTAFRVNYPGYEGVYKGTQRIGTGTGSWRFDAPNGNYVIIRHYVNVSRYTETSIYTADGTRVAVNANTDITISGYVDPPYGVYAYYDYYMRWLHDKENVAQSHRRSQDNDIVAFSLNYRFVKPLTEPGLSVAFEAASSEEPTEYGMDEYGKYFVYPEDIITPGFQFRPYFPIARSAWSPFSLWLQADFSTFTYSDTYSVGYTVRDAYALPEIVKILLHEIVPDPVNGVTIHHDGTEEYSGWLYGSEVVRKPFLIPNTNVKKTYYSNPAQKGEMSMRQLLDMLRDCFNVYWYITDDGKFCLEHISKFMSGDVRGSVVADLGTMMAPRNLNDWSFGQNKWTYEKTELPERVEYSFAEQQTEVFNGCVLQYRSNYVQKGEVDKVTVSGFSADVDYTVELPSSVSDDGWVVVVPEMTDGAYKVPIEFFIYKGTYVAIQNAKMAFYNLFFDSLRYNMSCPRFRFVDKEYTEASADGAMSTARVRKQSVTFPADEMPDPYGLIRTGLSSDGDDGEIAEMVYAPLSDSIKATLYFDTEK